MSVYAQRVASDGPAAWWPLVLPAGSSSVPDQSGNGYTASPTAVTFGYADTPVAGEPWSASFNGSAYADATSPMVVSASERFASFSTAQRTA